MCAVRSLLSVVSTMLGRRLSGVSAGLDHQHIKKIKLMENCEADCLYLVLV